ncbi:cobyrinate a,c-diamide synthase [Luteipulveratus mongoliensis]|uniref:Hydrogenobyrinate a,c-diamide synthase n=1 Tax=Luteipulveratus mongoliensis TaxID=571913 RepID=A0A0K1JR22_9MICO|nr:cobyrinate a,c-diamide synthase [Luteipulveratus mongoliensis]AKU19171.1 cobyrinic acid a,c-diamide synthase [Luteipulveratus mongoliensis]
MTHLPRVVIAAPASGHGKTTVATGLMAALRQRGLAVSGHKVGPDYIDPGYHALATGRPGRNLDPQLVGEERLVPLLRGGARGADVAVVEGVMGLYDGAIGGQGYASTAHVARVIGAPVVLVVDISHASRSIAAVVHGMATFDPAIRISGVVLNKSGSERHAGEVRDALQDTGIPVLGVLGRDDGIVAPGRHLGLVPAVEQHGAAQVIERLAAQVAERIDLDHVLEIASSASALDGEPWDAGREVEPVLGSPVIAVAGGRAFSFRYAETDELLRAAGCVTVEFDPLQDDDLPARTQGIYLGGGFPEAHASGLAANGRMLDALRRAIAAGTPTVAECAGLLYLCRSLDGTPMVGAIPAEARMAPRLTLSYRTAIAPADHLLGLAGSRLAGHEFHRTTVSPVAGDAPAWLLDGRPEGYSMDPAGVGRETLHASYLHTHWAGHPAAAQRFAASAAAAVPTSPTVHAASLPEAGKRRGLHDRPGAGLEFHGDQELGPGLIDFAVNVQQAPRPAWLDAALERSLAATSYPDAAQARDALAARHLRPVEQVLPTAGAAEAFTLIARARAWQRPVVIHPQFTEPDRALAAAGLTPEHVVLGPDFELDPVRVPTAADLVIVGNPTNPTGVLHPAATLRALVRPGRVVVVDEAFIDAVPGERESLAAQQISGLLVLRSLTKTWSIPGVRAGYIVGDPEIVADCVRQQPPWSVSAPALAALAACTSPEARAEAERRAVEIDTSRTVLERGLRDLGVRVVPGSAAPFVLAQVGSGVREALRDKGFAVRRGDTFPGLDPAWARIAVRDSATTRRLLHALAEVHAEGLAVTG